MFGSQATIYAIRERRHLWVSRPSLLLALSSLVDIAIASDIGGRRNSMTRLPAPLVVATLAAAVVFSFVLDLVKVPVFAHFVAAELDTDLSYPKPVVSLQAAHKADPAAEANAKIAPEQTERIAKRAYELYEQEGHRDGAALQNWQTAESEIRLDLASAKPMQGSATEPQPTASAKS